MAGLMFALLELGCTLAWGVFRIAWGLLSILALVLDNILLWASDPIIAIRNRLEKKGDAIVDDMTKTKLSIKSSTSIINGTWQP